MRHYLTMWIASVGVPSIDQPVELATCAAKTRAFNARAADGRGGGP